MVNFKKNRFCTMETFASGNVIRKITFTGKFSVLDTDAMYEIGLINRTPPVYTDKFDHVFKRGTIDTLLTKMILNYSVTELCSI